MEFDLRIGHSGDALTLIDQILEQSDLDPETKEAIEAIKDAIERNVI